MKAIGIIRIRSPISHQTLNGLLQMRPEPPIGSLYKNFRAGKTGTGFEIPRPNPLKLKPVPPQNLVACTRLSSALTSATGWQSPRQDAAPRQTAGSLKCQSQVTSVRNKALKDTLSTPGVYPESGGFVSNISGFRVSLPKFPVVFLRRHSWLGRPSRLRRPRCVRGFVPF